MAASLREIHSMDGQDAMVFDSLSTNNLVLRFIRPYNLSFIRPLPYGERDFSFEWEIGKLAWLPSSASD